MEGLIILWLFIFCYLNYSTRFVSGKNKRFCYFCKASLLMSVLKKFITYGLFPTYFLGVMVFVFYGISQDWLGEAVLGVIFLVSLIVISVCERINPEYPVWNNPRGDIFTDIVHLLISVVLLKKGMEYFYKIFLFSLSEGLALWLGMSFWPEQLPLFFQFIFGILVLDFFQYWWHRLSHTVPFLWRFHATHHSVQRLYWLNTGRFHPIDALVSNLAGFAPLILLGINPDALLLVTAWVSADGMFQHCNIRLRFGWLNWVFSTAELHRWHHSVNMEESCTNYGENIIVWDVIFGTRYLPENKPAGEKVGLTGLDSFPQDYVGQITSPFKWNNIERTSVKNGP